MEKIFFVVMQATLTQSKQKICLFTGLLLVIGITPFFTHIQWLTGPLVNAILILSTVFLGPFEAVVMGLVPSVVALSSGTLPLPLAPMVPFIMIGNALFISIFHYSQKAGFMPAVLLASIVKFMFLSGTVSLLMATMLKSEIVAKLSVMMSWPQLFTALVGGVIAFGILKGLKKI